MIKPPRELDYSSCSILSRLQPGQKMFKKSIQQRIAIIQFKNNQSLYNNFCAFFRDVFSNFGNVSNLIMQRLAVDPCMFLKVEALIKKNYTKDTS